MEQLGITALRREVGLRNAAACNARERIAAIPQDEFSDQCSSVYIDGVTEGIALGVGLALELVQQVRPLELVR